MGQGSGSVTTFSRADGFATIGRHHESCEAGTVDRRAAARARPAAGRPGRDRQPLHRPRLPARRTAAARRAHRSSSPSAARPGWTPPSAASATSPASTCSIPDTGEYNRPFLTPALELVPGYGRLQGIVFRPGDARFEGRIGGGGDRDGAATIPTCLMVNRNQGSGTRALIDRLLGGARPRRLRRAAAQPQRRRRGRGAGPRRLGRDARHRRPPRRARIPAGAAEQYDFVVPQARADGRASSRSQRCCSEPSTREALRTAWA